MLDGRARGARARLRLAGLRPLRAGDRDLHAAAEGADVADDDLVTVLQPLGDLRDPQLLVDGAELHGGDVERLAVDAIDERLAVLLALAQRGGGHGDDIFERAADHATGGEGAAPQRVAGIGDLYVHGDGARGRID